MTTLGNAGMQPKHFTQLRLKQNEWSGKIMINIFHFNFEKSRNFKHVQARSFKIKYF